MKLLILCFLSLSVFANQIPGPPKAKVQIARGDVSFENVKVQKGSLLDKGGLLKTGPKSFVRVFIEKWQSSIVLGPSSEMQLDLSKDADKKYSLSKGTCRWFSSAKKILGLEKKGGVHTKSASFGVRGTDFFISYAPQSNESEIVVFDGKVLFTSGFDANDKKVVNKGQWGGIGGQFGNKITDLKDLTPEQLESIKAKLRKQ